MKRFIPNTITTLNLLTGCVGVSFAYQGRFDWVLYCLIACGVFDFLDGTAARLLQVRSEIGKELDSLADVISFGFLPGTILFMMLQETTTSAFLPYAGYLVTAFSALRLAKFNVDTRQTTDFIGVNTPMNSFVIISLPFIAAHFPVLFSQSYPLIAIIACSSYLLISEIKLFSMKVSNLSWESNRYKYLFLLISVIFLAIFQYLAMPLILLAYIVFSSLHFSEAGAKN
ncbi:CDP-alcohol phosphatidyltransferase family protein [Sphingobacterium sp. lm-10]|uniref:CDP-alcohol phosphatidyltransferase family protein n=1 Tax=Sphingobacterium sp. lm-10 TaxID=2944904 RepID=UPI0020220B8D|nr:CDP-alcohol phosphatidyltransferase family protein [Sphingobacterium sp. lm-10]MCL7987894.1 CDP-alcohol phosphatidyltransferase family protein [Sphingobacterium sp. lm-10]